jgi:hypothetical protein
MNERFPMTQLPYHALPSLANLYFEDSYVLALQPTDQRVVLTVDAALTSAHPHYHPPRPNEQYCYEHGQLIFPNVTQLQWVPSTLQPAIDASGKFDYGNIDVFYVEDGRYHLEGDWGVLDIVSDPPSFELVSSQQ